jgi:hypothetical protein
MNAGSGGLAACSTRGARAAVQRRADTNNAGNAGVCDHNTGGGHACDGHAGGDAGANDLRP